MTHRKTRLDCTCHVLREDPGLAHTMSPERRALAEETCTARALNVRRGQWNQSAGHFADAVALVVLDGLLLRRVSVNGRAGAELLGPGDVVRPWQDAGDAELPRATAWRALRITRLAVLDDDAVQRMADYPELMRGLLERSVQRSGRLAVNMAIVHHPRVEMRLCMLFWHLADRWGCVRNGQTFLPLRLSHTVLADLIAAQRPTVSTVLSRMERRGIVRPAPDGWLLLTPPPEDRPGPDDPVEASPRGGSTRPGREMDRLLDQTRPRSRPARVRRIARDVSARPG
ncbi:MAG TPA: Crp/Fnr family transcriptional regulator [Solirubrobacteraceae bacterium]|nr:Crp/Fnr family transcriptional regulator [Solirubrobacteraceae bacterium]